ncbi:hypothetical protein [Streptomyces sp. NPDC086010]|uniref:hypothetical protein n=1 Tax=Streptomyces sp. NPDC086010 TaxID=3365745 RepID=UPI0037CD5445
MRGRGFPRGLDDYIADAALFRHARQLTVIVPGRRAPAPNQVTYTADFAWPHQWWVAGIDGKPPRESSRYERPGSPASSCRTRSAIQGRHSVAAARMHM